MFWLITIGLTAITVAALIYTVVRPRSSPNTNDAQTRALHHQRLAELDVDIRDQTLAETERDAVADEITQTLLEEHRPLDTRASQTPSSKPWASVVTILLIVPAIAFLTYLQLGEVSLVGSAAPLETAEAPHEQQSIDELITMLEARLRDTPNSAEAWLLLGRSLMTVNRFADAVTALARAQELSGDVPQVMLLHAHARVMAADGAIDAETRALVDEILAIAPDNVIALWLAGLGAVEIDDRKAALGYLNRARSLSTDTQQIAQLDAIIANLNTPAATTDPADTSAAAIHVRVELASEFADDIDPGDTLFIIARDRQRQGPPLAVSRASAAVLPYEVTLDATMAMAPQYKLRLHDRVVVTARISRSGQAIAQVGDLQGDSEVVTVGEVERVVVAIDQRITE